MSDNKHGMNNAIVSRIRSALEEVKSAAADSLDSIPSSVGRRPTDLAKILGIDMKLAWKLGRLLRANTPGEILHSIAGSAGIKKTITGIQHSGADAEKVDRLQSACDALLAMIKELAGDRGSFETLVTGMGEADSLQLSIDMRRKYFSAVSSMIGVQCASQYRMISIGPESDPELGPESDTYSVAAVHSWSDLKQFTLHGGIALHRPTELSGCKCCHFSRVENLDPSVSDSLPVLPEFSRLDQITLAESVPDGVDSIGAFRRVDTNLGLGSSADVTLGQVAHGLRPLSSDGGGVFFQDCVELKVPCKELVLDLIVAPGLMPELAAPQMKMHSLWSSLGHGAPDDRDQLPVDFKITKLRVDEVPQSHPQGWSRSSRQSLFSLVSSRMNWNFAQFDHFRICLSFPFMPSKMQTLVELKPKAR